INTAMQIIKDESVKDLSPIPFLSLMTNSVIATLYGLMRGNPSLILPNFAGFLSGLFCSMVYVKHQKTANTPWYILSASIMATAIFLATKGREKILGSLGCVICIVMFASPLATIQTVLRDKNTNALPFMLSLFSWLNGLLWGLYGLLVLGDPIVYGPNIVGFFCACLQLSLFAVFGMPHSAPVLAEQKVF
ncbi:sugar efflux transporter for intercellular exchange-domain-containing protein, partial [Ochromonadaceae sp. CCMP2298]